MIPNRLVTKVIVSHLFNLGIQIIRRLFISASFSFNILQCDLQHNVTPSLPERIVFDTLNTNLNLGNYLLLPYCVYHHHIIF